MPITRRGPAVGPNGEALQLGQTEGLNARPSPPPDEPTQMASDPIRASESPRELHPAAPTTLAPQPPPAMGGSSQATPSRPVEPAPVAAGTPQPFTPMANPAVTQLASTQPQGLASIMRRGIEPTPGGGQMFGRAGGMLGGGLGVPHLGGGGPDPTDLSALIASLFQMAAGGQR